jgi:hypothetical protein
MRVRLLALVCLLGPASSWACEVISSPLHRVNPDAVVEQPEPPPIEKITARASLSPAIAGGCSDEGCPDGSAVTFTITLPEDAPRNFGYAIEILDPHRHVPFIQGGLAPLQGTDTIEVVLLWGSNAQFQASPFQARLRTINLKGELGPWSEPVTVVPAPQTNGVVDGGAGLVLFGLLLWGRRRRLI